MENKIKYLNDVEYVDADNVKIYEKNNKIHSKASIEKMASDIEENGFVGSILVDGDYTIISGHKRYSALLHLQEKQVPVTVAKNKKDVRAWRIWMNKSSEHSMWDKDALKEEFSDLDLTGFDLDLTGFEFDEIVDITQDKKAKKVREETSQLEKNPSKVVHTCPSCGHEFN